MQSKTFSITRSKKKGEENHCKVLFKDILTVNNLELARKELLQALTEMHSFTLKLENISSIDLAGIQLIDAFIKSVKTAKKTISLSIDIEPQMAELLRQGGIYELHETQLTTKISA